ncbi:hypothetical protein OF83DRAFT_1115952, partial [Amylostereum chailletii]
MSRTRSDAFVAGNWTPRIDLERRRRSGSHALYRVHRRPLHWGVQRTPSYAPFLSFQRIGICSRTPTQIALLIAKDVVQTVPHVERQAHGHLREQCAIFPSSPRGTYFVCTHLEGSPGCTC